MSLSNFRQWNGGPLKNFLILHGNAFSLFIFIKWKNYFNLPFNDTYKMCCCHLFYSKLKLRKTAVFKLQAVKDMLLDSYFRQMARQGVVRWRRSCVLNVIFEISWHMFLLFLLLTLYIFLLAGLLCKQNYITAACYLTETKLHLKVLLVFSVDPIRTRVNGLQV